MDERLLSHLFSFHLKTKVKVISILYVFFFSSILKIIHRLGKKSQLSAFLKERKPHSCSDVTVLET